MIFREIECGEIMKIIFNMRAFRHGKTEITKNLHHFFPDL